MKISKIIFLSLIGVIALWILAGALDLRINGVKRYDYVNMNKKKTDIPHFKVLHLNGSKNISITQSDSCFIEVRYPKDSIAPTLNYTIREDTLIFNALKSDYKKGIFYTIGVNSDLN